MLDTILVLTGGGGGSGAGASGPSSDEVVHELASAIASRVPKDFDVTRAHPTSFAATANGSMNSFGVFLSQEILRFNGLIRVMRSSLKMLQKAIKGLVVMSGPLEKMYHGFLIQKVPQEWEAAGYPCLKPLTSWTEDFSERIACLDSWLCNGPPKAYWLPGFFFPQGFMTAVKQQYSRAHKIAIDNLVVGCDVLSEEYQSGVTHAPDYGVHIYGLYLEGARFDRTSKMLAESTPSVLFDIVPLIWLKPILMSESQPTDVYSCPLYKTSTRAGTLSTTGHSTNFVVALDIRTDKSSDHWIRRGCAMLCMLDT